MNKTIYYKFILLLVVLSISAPFFLPGKDGGRLINAKEVFAFNMDDGVIAYIKSWFAQPENGGQQSKLDSLMKLKKIKDVFKAEDKEIDQIKSNRTILYKWQDEKGVWHYSDVDIEGKTLDQVKKVSINPNQSVYKMVIPKSAEDQVKIENNNSKKGEYEPISNEEDEEQLTSSDQKQKNKSKKKNKSEKSDDKNEIIKTLEKMIGEDSEYMNNIIETMKQAVGAQDQADQSFQNIDALIDR